MANPLWYPALPPQIRGKMLRFVQRALEEERFDPARANEYCA
jgi:hypothetical protein